MLLPLFSIIFISSPWQQQWHREEFNQPKQLGSNKSPWFTRQVNYTPLKWLEIVFFNILREITFKSLWIWSWALHQHSEETSEKYLQTWCTVDRARYNLCENPHKLLTWISEQFSIIYDVLGFQRRNIFHACDKWLIRVFTVNENGRKSIADELEIINNRKSQHQIYFGE